MDQQEYLEHKVAVLTRLVEISTVLNSTLHIGRLLEHIMDAAAKILNAESASIILYRSKRRELIFAATSAESVELQLIGKKVPIEGSIAGTVIREQRLIQIDDTSNDPRHYTGVDKEKNFHTQNMLAVPMTSRDKLIGVLEIINKRSGKWSKDDHSYAQILASQSAAAIENAQMLQALSKANDELSELDKLKNDFIAIASHELRTPLGVILGYSTFIQEGASDPEMQRQADKIVENSLHLRRIIGELANLSYLQQHESDLRRRALSLAEVFQSVMQQPDVLELAGQKRHKFDVSMPSAEILIDVDRARFEMALTHILTNAIRFTPEGGYVSMYAQPGEEDVMVCVKDTGVGIPPDKLERIFDKFYQIEDHKTRHHGGLGVGLSIAKAMVEVHGGSIWAESEGMNQGATFTLTLPLVRDAVPE